MNYLKAIFSYLSSNLNRQVAAIATDGFSSLYIFLIFFSRIACIARWFIKSLTMYVDLSFIIEFDILNKQKPVVKNFQSQLLVFITAPYYLFIVRLISLLYLNSTDKLVWFHLYDLVVRNRNQVKLHFWGVRSVRQWWFAPSNHIVIQRVSHQAVTSWITMLKSLIIFSRLKTSRSAKLLFYPHLEEKLRIKCALICYFFEALMVLIFAYYLVVLYFDMGHSLGVLQKLPVTTVQWSVTAAAYLAICHAAYYTYASLLLIEMLIMLVCHLYVVQYRIVNSDLERVKAAMFKAGDTTFANHPSSLLLLASLNRFTSAYRTGHTRLTVFILHFNDSLISKVIAYYLHYYLPYHSYRLVYIYYQRQKLHLIMAVNSYWFLVFMWLFLLVITLAVARVNSAICKSGKALSVIFAQKGLEMAANFGPSRRQSNYYHSTTKVGGLREALKLAAYFEMIWREEKQLAFTAGQANTAMSWRFIYEIVILYSSYVLYFASKFMEQDSSSA